MLGTVGGLKTEPQGAQQMLIHRKNSNKCPGIYFNTWPSGEKGWAIIRGYIHESCETQEITLPSSE